MVTGVVLFCVVGFCIDRPGAFYFAQQSFKFQAFLIHAEIFYSSGVCVLRLDVVLQAGRQ